MRQAIVTKYLGPTSHRGSRIKATCQAKSITVPWDDALDMEANHYRAAMKLMTFLGWGDHLVGGSMPNETGFCFVVLQPFSLATTIISP